jgi:phosphate starvation-inducible PhoH-like protein
LIEKIISLSDISLVDFLGVNNQNIDLLSEAFPKSKIISRGNEIRIQGTTSEILKINEIVIDLLQHYHKYGKVGVEQVHKYIKEEEAHDLNEDHEEIIVYGSKGFRIKPKTPNQRKLVEAIENNDLVFAIGPAGTGKTFIAVALAVRALKNKEIKKIIFTRPAVEAGENLGFLPGDFKEKIDPYLRPIYDALEEMIPAEKLRQYIENKVIEIAPLAYMRGRTLNHAYILLDEAQNTTPLQIKMFLTRMGPHSKVIVTGDISQVDLPHKQISGLRDATRKLKNIENIAFINLNEKDVIRHKLVREIIMAYEPKDKTEEKDNDESREG